jgi:hypothetical protein
MLVVCSILYQHIFISPISIRTLARAILSSVNSYPENRLRDFAKISKFLSGQPYGISKKFSNFYPDPETASEGIFRGPVKLFVSACVLN